MGFGDVGSRWRGLFAPRGDVIMLLDMLPYFAGLVLPQFLWRRYPVFALFASMCIVILFGYRFLL